MNDILLKASLNTLTIQLVQINVIFHNDVHTLSINVTITVHLSSINVTITVPLLSINVTITVPMLSINVTIIVPLLSINVTPMYLCCLLM